MSADAQSLRDPVPLRLIGGPLDGLEALNDSHFDAVETPMLEIDTLDGHLHYYKARPDGAMHWIGSQRKDQV